MTGNLIRLSTRELVVKKRNVLLLVDISGSMDEDAKIEQAKAGAIDFARSVSGSGQGMTGLATFGSRAALICDPTDAAILARKISSLEVGAGGSTNLAAGLILANKVRPLNTVVVITDGKPDDEEKALAAADVLKRRNLEIICIGTDDANMEFLAKLGKAIHVDKGDLRKAIGQARFLLKG